MIGNQSLRLKLNVHLKLLISVITLLLFFKLQGQEPFVKVIDSNFNVKSTKLYTILEDDLGQIWVGTSNGLYSYNGYNWKEYRLDQFVDKEIINLSLDKDRDRIWCVNLRNEWGYVEADSIKMVTTFNNEVEWVWDFLIDQSTLYAFCRIANGFQIQVIPLDNEGFVDQNSSMLELNPSIFNASQNLTNGNLGLINNRIVLHTQLGLVLLERDSIISTLSLSRKFYGNNRSSVYDQKIKVLSGKDVLYTLDSNFNLIDSFHLNIDRNIERYFNIGGDILSSLVPNGTNYHSKGLQIEFDNGFFKNKIIHDAIRGDDGMAWIVNSDSRLGCIPNIDIKRYRLDELSISGISFLKAGKDYLYISSSDGKLIRLDKNFDFLPLRNFKEEIRDLKETQDELFIATDSKIFFDQTKFPHKIPCPKSIATIGDTMYIASCKGVKVWEKSGQHRIKVIGEDKRCYSIAGDINGFLYGIDRDLVFLDPKSLNYRKVESWPKNKIAYQIVFDQYKSFWINTRTNELYSYKEGQLTRFESKYLKNKSRIDNIKYVNGLLWIFSEGHVFILQDDELRPITGKGNLVDLNFEDVEFFNDSYWLSSKMELFQIPERLLHLPHKNPKIIIENISVNDRRIDKAFPIYLKHDENLVSFKLHSVYHYSDDTPKYYYRLIKDGNSGSNNIFHTSEELITFSQLAPGNYRFQVSNNFHFFEEDPNLAIDFNINIPFWRSWWFISLFLLSIIGITALAFYYYEKIRTKRKQKQDELIERLEEMELEALQLKIHPHFINNLLNSVRHFLMVDNDRNKSIKVINSISVHMRSVFNQINRKEISLKEELEFLSNYCTIQELMTNKTIDLEITLDTYLEQNKESIFLHCLIIQPLIENSVKYVKENPINIKIDLAAMENHLKISVTDNGAGIEADKKSQSGLQVVEKRIQLINRSKELLNISGSTVHFRLGYTFKESNNPNPLIP